MHGLLHIADGIEAAGPVWATWLSMMKWYCSYIKQSTVQSRKHPLASINNRILETTQLEMAKMKYGLVKTLSLNISKTIHETFGTLSTLSTLKYFKVPQSASKCSKALLGLLMKLKHGCTSKDRFPNCAPCFYCHFVSAPNHTHQTPSTPYWIPSECSQSTLVSSDSLLT